MERAVQTVRTLKIVLPILFLLFVGIIVAFYSSRSIEPEQVKTASSRPDRAGEQPRLISYEFEDTQTIGNRVISRIRARKTVGFESGWYTLDQAELDIYRKDGSMYTMTAPSVEFQAETKEARAEGGVIVTSQDGLDLRTESINFDGRRLTNRIPVRFTMSPWRGTARGADLDVETETLVLNDGVDVSFTAEDGEKIDLESETATFNRSSGAATFEGEVRLVRAGDLYESHRVIAQADQTHEKLIGLEGQTDVRLTVAAGSDLLPDAGEETEGRKVIRAARFLGKFDGRGEMTAVELYSADEPVSVELRGQAIRTVNARSARLNLVDDAAESLELYGNVNLEEQGDLRRKLHAERMVMTFDRPTGDATSAVFDGNIRYSDVTNEARAQRLFYDIQQDRVMLSAVPGSAPTISSGPQRISADQILIEPGGRLLRAEGRVITRIVNDDQAATAAESAIFPDDAGAIFVNSDALVIRERDGFAAFSGNVRAWQGDNTLFANELQITSGGETIHARGKVRTILHNTGEKRGEPMKSRSDRLEARRADNRIELIENVVVESEGRSLASDRAIFIFSPDQQLDRVEAIGHLKLNEPATGRSGTGEKALYQVAEEKILIEGNPAEIQEPRGTIRGQQIVLDMKRNRVDVLQGDSPTEATYNAEPSGR